MKTFNTIIKVLTALAAIIGAVYVLATYGDKIAQWAQNLLGAKKEAPTETNPIEETVEEETPAEETAVTEETVAEEDFADKAVVAEEAPVEDAPVADESDFEG